MGYLLDDKGYDADWLRHLLLGAGAIPGRRNRKCTIRYDKDICRGRHLIGNAFFRLKDLRRATPIMKNWPSDSYQHGDRLLNMIKCQYSFDIAAT